MIAIHEAGPHDRARWDLYVLGHPGSHFAQRFAWRGVMARAYGVRPRWWLAEDHGAIHGVLPLFEKPGGTLFSAPGGLLADHPDAAAALLEPARALLERSRGAWIELRDQRHQWPGLETVSEHVTMELRLERDPEAQWKRFDAKLRNQIRKAEKAGFRERWGPQNLPDFHAVLLENLRDLGTPVLGADFYRDALDAYGNDATVLILDAKDGPAGAMFLVRHGTTLADPWASSLRRYFADCPNMLLYWSAIRFAIEAGLERFDFGRSQPGSGTFRFKSQWGAGPVPLHYQYVLGRAERAPTLAGQKQSFDLAVRMWQKLPLPLARALGPAARRRFPEAL